MKPRKQKHMRVSLVVMMSSPGCDMESLGKFVSSLSDDAVIELFEQLVKL